MTFRDLDLTPSSQHRSKLISLCRLTPSLPATVPRTRHDTEGPYCL